LHYRKHLKNSHVVFRETNPPICQGSIRARQAARFFK